MRTRTWAVRLGLGLALAGAATGVVAARGAPAHFDLESHYESLLEEYQDAERAFYKELMAAEPAEQALLMADHPWKQHLPRFLEVVELGQGTDVGARALVTIFTKGLQRTPDDAWFACEVLVNDYIEHEVLADLAGQMRYQGEDERARSALKKMAADSPHASVRAAAHFTLGVVLMGDEATRAEAREHLETVVAKYGELESERGPSWAEQAEGSLYELDHLQIGQTAPDFASTDETGTAFNLSEYRGKVVLVDFWGFW